MSLHILSLIVFQYSLMLTPGLLSATIDQSQTGDLNVHINLKDLRIVALFKGKTEEYVDYDYAYDYSEMTIKPNNSTTPKPANVSSIATLEENTIETTTQTVVELTTPTKNTTLPPPAVTTAAATSVHSRTTTTTVASINSNSTTNNIAETSSTTTGFPAQTTFVTPPKNGTGCKKNYIMNKDGECEFTLYDGTNALLKLVKLSQKLKLRRENKRSDVAQEKSNNRPI